MVDISMCNRVDCPKRLHCFRYIAEPDEYRQSYIVIEGNVDKGCDNYWQCRNGKELAYMNKVNR